MTALADKVAIVTGASSGIGYATAKPFAREGAKVVVTARRQAELEALVDEIEEAGGHAVAVAGDVRDEALAKALDTALIVTGPFVGCTVGFPGVTAYAASKPRADRPDPGHRRRVRREGHPRERHFAGRHRHADGPLGRQHPCDARLRRGPACAQAPGGARKRSRARSSIWHRTPRPS